MNKQRLILSIGIPTICTAITIGCLAIFNNQIHETIFQNYNAPMPVISAKWSNVSDGRDIEGDYYVSLSGDDLNDGSKEHPFRTIEKARDVVRTIDKTDKDGINICIKEGEYEINNFGLFAEDSGTETCQITYTGQGNVVFNSGISLSPSLFKNVSEYPEISSRLTESAKSHTKVIDLTSQGISKEQIGSIYAYGSYNTSGQYEGDTTGPIFSEIFINEKRMPMARYPNEGYIETDEVVFSSRGSNISLPNGDPKGDVYKINNDLAKRINGWKDLNNVWMYGFYKYDWADQSTPILSFDINSKELTTKYFSFFGAEKGKPYYFFNCLEELDSPGEYYIDRDNNLLVIYETENFNSSKIELSISTEPTIRFNANYVTLDNIKITGTRDVGIYANGFNHHSAIKNCKIYNVGEGGMLLLSNDCTISHNEIYETGSYGIGLHAGDKNSLTKGNVVINNNYIHDYQKISKTLGAGIQTYGAGFHITNNEICYGNHTGIHYSGIYHLIENNNIHHVCQESTDSGAIYAGRSWTSYGNIIRNNLIYNLGSEKHNPNGIYLDDALSGQNVYGNLLINIPGNGILLGGGRDLDVYDNIIVNAKKNAISYDARAKEGVLNEMWFSEHVKQGGDMWIDLNESPWKEESWQNAFPEYKNLTDDFSDLDNPYFFVNPANSKVNNNLLFDRKLSIGDINKEVKKYSDISSNYIYSFLKMSEYFKDIENGNYCLKDNQLFKNKNYINLETVGLN